MLSIYLASILFHYLQLLADIYCQQECQFPDYILFEFKETTETDSPEEAGTEKETETGQGTETQKTGSGKTNSGSGRKEQTSPPETVFKKLAPSYNRYTLLRDEL